MTASSSSCSSRSLSCSLFSSLVLSFPARCSPWRKTFWSLDKETPTLGSTFCCSKTAPLLVRFQFLRSIRCQISVTLLPLSVRRPTESSHQLKKRRCHVCHRKRHLLLMKRMFFWKWKPFRHSECCLVQLRRRENSPSLRFMSYWTGYGFACGVLK